MTGRLPRGPWTELQPQFHREVASLRARVHASAWLEPCAAVQTQRFAQDGCSLEEYPFESASSCLGQCMLQKKSSQPAPTIIGVQVHLAQFDSGRIHRTQSDTRND